MVVIRIVWRARWRCAGGIREGVLRIGIHHRFHQIHSRSIGYEGRGVGEHLPVFVHGKMQVRGPAIHLDAVGGDDFDSMALMGELAYAGCFMLAVRFDIGRKPGLDPLRMGLRGLGGGILRENGYVGVGDESFGAPSAPSPAPAPALTFLLPSPSRALPGAPFFSIIVPP